MAKVIDNLFELGDVVYLKTDREQMPRIVFCIRVYQKEYIYELASGTTTSCHYDFELSGEVNVLIKTE